MQPALVRKILGLLLMMFSGSMLPPTFVSVFYSDGEVFHFLGASAVTLAVGLALWVPVRGVRRDLRARDGFIIVTMFWTVLSLVSALPFLFAPHLSYTDAVFEAVSGFTTTGATVIAALEVLPESVLYYRQQLQWLGGAGIIVLAVAILPMLGVGGMQLYRAEVPGPVKSDKLTPRIAQTAQAFWYMYVSMTLACAAAYWLAGMTVFDAIAHSLTTISTGGFSPHDASMAYFDSVAIELIAIVFMLLGAMNFAIHFAAWRGGSLVAYLRDPEVRTFLGLSASFVVLFTVVLAWLGEYPNPIDALRHAGFQVVSVITSTGYTTQSFAAWPLFLPILLIIISFIGGCAGSTAGGMKVLRMMLMYKQGLRELKRLIHPRSVLPIKVGGKTVQEDVLATVWGFFALYLLATIILTMVLMATGLDPVSAFSAVAASINVLGPGLGSVAANFASVPDVGKWALAFAMLLGRLEVFTLMVLLTPAFWRQ